MCIGNIIYYCIILCDVISVLVVIFEFSQGNSELMGNYDVRGYWLSYFARKMRELGKSDKCIHAVLWCACSLRLAVVLYMQGERTGHVGQVHQCSPVVCLLSLRLAVVLYMQGERTGQVGQVHQCSPVVCLPPPCPTGVEGTGIMPKRPSGSVVMVKCVCIGSNVFLYYTLLIHYKHASYWMTTVRIYVRTYVLHTNTSCAYKCIYIYIYVCTYIHMYVGTCIPHTHFTYTLQTCMLIENINLKLLVIYLDIMILRSCNNTPYKHTPGKI